MTPPDRPQPAPERPSPVGPPHEGLTVAFVPGVMPGKWFDRWDRRHGRTTPLTRLPLEEGQTGLGALADGVAHLALLRPDAEPAALDRRAYHAVELYRERQVVILPVDHVLTLLDEIPVAELAEERMLQEPQSAPEWAEASAEHRAAHPPRPLPPMRDTGDAVELVAAGLGLLIAPMSLARVHHRKDLTHRPLADAAERPVCLVWPRLGPGERPEPDEAVIQEFAGITRGRREDSSRGELGGSGEGRGGASGRGQGKGKDQKDQKGGKGAAAGRRGGASGGQGSSSGQGSSATRGASGRGKGSASRSSAGKRGPRGAAGPGGKPGARGASSRGSRSRPPRKRG